MLRVAVDAVAPGAVLARPLYAPTGQPVLREGHPLNDSVLPRLASFGIRYVWLEEPALAGITPCEPLQPDTALRAGAILTRLAAAAHDGTPRLPPALRQDLLNLAGRIVEELEALGRSAGARPVGLRGPGPAGPAPAAEAGAPLPYPAPGDAMGDWVAGVLNRAVLAGLLALSGPYVLQARDFVLAAFLQDVGLWRVAEVAPACHPVAALDGLGGLDGAGTGNEGTGSPAGGGPAGGGPAGGLAGGGPTGRGSIHRAARSHVTLSLQWLAGVDLGGLVRALVAQHHEQLDGAGYPDGLRGDAFHPAARRLAAVTAYTLAVSGCAHRAGWLPHEAYEWLLAEGGGLWGPDVVEELAALLFPYPPGTLVQLDGGLWGVVVDCAGARRLRPRVRLLPARWQPGAGAVGAGQEIDLLDERTRQITAWAVAWPVAPAGAPAPAGGGR
ncbi:HD-GYP domain-containing protein [Thermaerobacter litoralis]